MSMHIRILVLTIMISICTSGLMALDVNVDEIKTEAVEFHNRENSGKVKADPKAEVIRIGTNLSRAVKESGSAAQGNYLNRYSVIRLMSGEEDKFSTDIFFIGKEANVTHVKHIRNMLTGYLSDMYGYDRASAGSIAVFLTYYNAVHRGDTDYFSSKYTAKAMEYINGENAGLDTDYKMWPGNTAVMIPLSDKKIDLFAIDSRDTREAARQEDLLKERKQMSDMKKETIAQEKKDIQKEKQELNRKEAKLNREKKQTEKKKQEAEKKQQAIETKKKEAENIKDPEEKKKAEEQIKKDEQDLEKDRLKIEKEEQAAEKKKEQLEKEKADTEKKEEQLSEKEKDLKQEEADIRKDELKEEIKKAPEQAAEKLQEQAEKLKQKEDELNRREDQIREEMPDKNIFANRLYYLKIKEYLDGGHYNNEMVMIDPATKKVLFRSEVTNICGRRYDVFSGGVVVVTHNGSHTAGHRLTLINRDTLKEEKTGTDDIFWRSFIEVRDESVYAVTVEDGSYYLAKFDKNLKRTARSSEKINENTFISFYDKYIYINREDRQIMVLNKDDLSLTDLIQP